MVRFSFIPLVSRCAALLLALGVSASFTSCKTPSPPPQKKTSGTMFSHDFDPPAHRPKNPANVRLKVSTSQQRVYVVEGDRVLLATPCSVGVNGSTGHGNFRITSKQARKRRVSQPGAGYPMPFWMEWKPAYGLHWGYVKPYPCTHGCIRLPAKAAAKIFAMTQVGTPLHIAHSQPEDATIGRTLPVLDDGPLPNPNPAYLMSEKFMDDIQYKGKLFVD